MNETEPDQQEASEGLDELTIADQIAWVEAEEREALAYLRNWHRWLLVCVALGILAAAVMEAAMAASRRLQLACRNHQDAQRRLDAMMIAQELDDLRGGHG